MEGTNLLRQKYKEVHVIEGSKVSVILGDLRCMHEQYVYTRPSFLHPCIQPGHVVKLLGMNYNQQNKQPPTKVFITQSCLHTTRYPYHRNTTLW